MKCTVCRTPAVIDVRRHNANFCREHFVSHCEEQVRRAIRHFAMMGHSERILVAVSGGKDSLALWDLLLRLGYSADGLYVGLGIDDYSDESAQYVRSFAGDRGLTLRTVDLGADHGFTIPGAARATRRSPCGACGLSKRHVFNSVALEHGYDVVATGHNLDDEAAVLLGNVLQWDLEYLARQHPALPARSGFVRKVKPLYRISERETAAYCVLEKIDYQVEECPMAAGNRHIGYKEVLNDLDARAPGSKATFLFGFLERAREQLAPHAMRTGDAGAEGDLEIQPVMLRACVECGAPTPAEVCAFCKLRERAKPGQ